MMIEKGIPLPAPRASYPFKDMVPGDSILVNPKQGEARSRHQSRVSASIFAFEKKNPGVKLTSKSEENGIRIWRKT